MIAMRNDYIYALLSNNTYHNATYNLPGAWEEFKDNFSPLIPANEFYAVPYINKQLKKIIIAFRGSEVWKNYVKDDIEIFFDIAPSLFLKRAVLFVETVRLA